ncbi:trehalose operon repressor [Peribacillus muralis]|uniref:trehalose operon repressor n=1 Tax=Peribacillus muralis TaxID=264697 RepID=UPI001F4EC9AC|nr:trehalose operon repressor [Peribacillus muralis]MCK1993852.1 trehalose operon repressor [Peribacillus muralis]MCK2013859.1 trehalose operon repressor [Peribacillus muralis]
MNSKYLVLYSDIVAKIEEGIFRTNSKLPSESSFMEEYRISRDTVRKSLHLLEQNGYIHKIKGKGSFVLDFSKFNFPVAGLISYKEMVEKLHLHSKTIIHMMELEKPDSNMVKLLDLTEAEKVWKVFRVRQINGKKIILDKDYFSSKFVTNLTKEICEDSIYRYIEGELGLKIGFSNKEITVEPCSEEDKQLLDIEDYDMVAVVKSTVHLMDGSLFQYSESRHRPDKFKFTDFARRTW